MQVLKVSKPTFNVLTTGNANLSFSSLLASHAIQSIVDIHFTSGTEFTINHNLGYVPKTWVVWKGSTYLNFRLPILTAVASGYDYYVTTTDIVVHRDGAFAHPDFIVIIFTRSPIP